MRILFKFTHQKAGHGLLAQVAKGLTEVDDEGVVGPEGGLDYGPVGDPAVTRHGVEIQISVQVVGGPLNLGMTLSSNSGEVSNCANTFFYLHLLIRLVFQLFNVHTCQTISLCFPFLASDW